MNRERTLSAATCTPQRRQGFYSFGRGRWIRLLPRFRPALGDERGCFRAATQVELTEDAGDVVLDGLIAEEHLLGDLLVGLPFRYGRQYLPLLRRQRRQLIRFTTGECSHAFQHLVGHRWIQQRLPA